MLTITIKAGELYDENKNEFVNLRSDQVLCLEHSLVSISKWESKWHKPFMDDRTPKTKEEIIDYIRCMTITQNVDPAIYYLLSPKAFEQIQNYISDSMTATWFNDKKTKGRKKRIITSELIYYWIVSLQIPFECQKWHINRLLTLIRVCNEENKEAYGTKNKKGSTRQMLSERAALNAARRKQLGSRG